MGKGAGWAGHRGYGKFGMDGNAVGKLRVMKTTPPKLSACIYLATSPNQTHCSLLEHDCEENKGNLEVFG